jgi:hypothetical protein
LGAVDAADAAGSAARDLTGLSRGAHDGRNASSRHRAIENASGGTVLAAAVCAFRGGRVRRRIEVVSAGGDASIAEHATGLYAASANPAGSGPAASANPAGSGPTASANPAGSGPAAGSLLFCVQESVGVSSLATVSTISPRSPRSSRADNADPG